MRKPYATHAAEEESDYYSQQLGISSAGAANSPPADLAALASGHADDPQPLFRDLPQADEYPVDALVSPLAEAVVAIQEKIQAPLAICAQSVLGAATLAVQGFCDVELPMGQKRPVSNFLVTVAGSGERKTSADQIALAPILDREKTLGLHFAQDQEDFEISLTAWQKQQQDDLKKNKDFASKKEAMKNLGAKPEPPLVPILTCPEPTFEGLTRLFASGYPSLGLFSAEGGQFLGGHAMNKDNRLKTASALSRLWDGDPLKRVRAGDGAHQLPGRRLSLHLLMQPRVAGELLGDPLLKDQGTLSRLLVAAPNPAAGSRFWRDTAPEHEEAIAKYSRALSDILERPQPLVDGTRNVLLPRRLPMSASARTLWINFADHVEKHIAPDGEFEAIREFANKLPEHASRLAGVLALVDDLDRPEITKDDLARGIELANFYASEALRLFEAGATRPELLLGQRVLDWLQGSWGDDLISLPDIYQKGPRPIRDKRRARRVVETLEEHGWLIPLGESANVAGVTRREVWRIVGIPK